MERKNQQQTHKSRISTENVWLILSKSTSSSSLRYRFIVCILSRTTHYLLDYRADDLWPFPQMTSTFFAYLLKFVYTLCKTKMSCFISRSRQSLTTSTMTSKGRHEWVRTRHSRQSRQKKNEKIVSGTVSRFIFFLLLSLYSYANWIDTHLIWDQCRLDFQVFQNFCTLELCFSFARVGNES